MKFRDPKTGEVFNSFEIAHTNFCRNRECIGCALNGYHSLFDCRAYYSDNPAEAARLMGYEVVEETKKDVLCRYCGNKMRPCPHQGNFWFERKCGSRSPVIWHGTEETAYEAAMKTPQMIQTVPGHGEPGPEESQQVADYIEHLLREGNT